MYNLRVSLSGSAGSGIWKRSAQLNRSLKNLNNLRGGRKLAACGFETRRKFVQGKIGPGVRMERCEFQDVSEDGVGREETVGTGNNC